VLVVAAEQKSDARARNTGGAVQGESGQQGASPRQGGAASGPHGAMVVAGDVDLATNIAFDQLANRGFMLNAVAWLLEENRALAIPPKDRSLSKLFLTQRQASSLFVLLVGGLPALAVTAGLVVWSRRRKRT
jgi:ABC-type uncharacterized transport system involved in gliding motility auxiliary subunit